MASYRDPEDLATLVARVALGDSAAYRRLYNVTSAKLFAVAIRILRDRSRVEEVLQDAFVNVWNSAVSDKAELASPMTWLLTIVRNRSLDYVRRVDRREVSPVVLANARMLGANGRQLLKSVYLPSAMTGVFSSLHTSVGLAFVGAVVGEYLGSARGVGYLILQAEGTFDIDTVFAGIVVLTFFALALDGVVTISEKRLMTWQPKVSETEHA